MFGFGFGSAWACVNPNFKDSLDRLNEAVQTELSLH